MHAHSAPGVFFPIFLTFWFQSTFLLKLKTDSIKSKNHFLITRIKIHWKNIVVDHECHNWTPHCTSAFNWNETLSSQERSLSLLLQRALCSGRAEHSEDAKHTSQIISIKRGTAKALCQNPVSNWGHNEGTSQALSPSQVSPPQSTTAPRPSNTSFLPCPLNRNTHGT